MPFAIDIPDLMVFYSYKRYCVAEIWLSLSKFHPPIATKIEPYSLWIPFKNARSLCTNDRLYDGYVICILGYFSYSLPTKF